MHTATVLLSPPEPDRAALFLGTQAMEAPAVGRRGVEVDERGTEGHGVA